MISALQMISFFLLIYPAYEIMQYPLKYCLSALVGTVILKVHQYKEYTISNAVSWMTHFNIQEDITFGSFMQGLKINSTNL